MSGDRPPQQTNTLGNASLALGIASTALVFGIATCALTAVRQGWIRISATPLYVCGASSAFLGALAAALGLAGLFGANRSRASALAGLVLGVVGVCLFLVAATQVGRSGG
jgi:hypothetical protein